MFLSLGRFISLLRQSLVSKMMIPPPLSGDATVIFLFLATFERAEMYLLGKVYFIAWWSSGFH